MGVDLKLSSLKQQREKRERSWEHKGLNWADENVTGRLAVVFPFLF